MFIYPWSYSQSYLCFINYYLYLLLCQNISDKRWKYKIIIKELFFLLNIVIQEPKSDSYENYCVIWELYFSFYLKIKLVPIKGLKENRDLKQFTPNFVFWTTDWVIITFDIVNLSKNFHYDLSFRQMEQVWPLVHLIFFLLS